MPQIEVNELVPLDKIRDYIDTSGIYEIICLENDRSYIGQSTSITRRIFDHLKNLNNNSHSNDLLQKDWLNYSGKSFAFRVIREIPYTDIESLSFEENVEINLRRRNNIVLYNDYARGYPKRESKVKKDEIDKNSYNKHLQSKPNKKFKRKHHEQSAREISCFDCGSVGYDGIYATHFKCDDGQLRCEFCIDMYLDSREFAIYDERQVRRSSATKYWRRQMGGDNLSVELPLAISSFVRKFGVRPAKIFMYNSDLSEWNEIPIEQSSIANQWYIDMPIPEEMD